MNYKEFKEYALNQIKERFGEEYECECHTFTKNNDWKRDGITVRKKNSSVAPIIYLDYLYEDYKNGLDLDFMIDKMMEVIKSQDKNMSIEDYTDFRNVKDKIIYRLVNYEKNKELLKNTPHRRLLDLVVLYYIDINDEKLGEATILINNALLKKWGISEDVLEELAKENSPKINKGRICLLQEEIAKYDPSEANTKTPPIFLLTNDNGIHGASVLLYDNFLKPFAESANSNLYLIPGNLDGICAIPTRLIKANPEMKYVIKEINAASPKQCFLSDKIYLYDKEKDEITILFE